MKTQMQELVIFIERQANETLSFNVKRALMGTVTVINATCIKPEKEMVIEAFNKGMDKGKEYCEGRYFDIDDPAEDYYNKTFKK